MVTLLFFDKFVLLFKMYETLFCSDRAVQFLGISAFKHLPSRFAERKMGEGRETQSLVTGIRYMTSSTAETTSQKTGKERRDSSEKMDGNKRVRCPHCSLEMKARKLQHHLAVRHSQ